VGRVRVTVVPPEGTGTAPAAPADPADPADPATADGTGEPVAAVPDGKAS
jgi:hypothetical protein